MVTQCKDDPASDSAGKHYQYRDSIVDDKSWTSPVKIKAGPGWQGGMYYRSEKARGSCGTRAMMQQLSRRYAVTVDTSRSSMTSSRLHRLIIGAIQDESHALIVLQPESLLLYGILSFRYRVFRHNTACDWSETRMLVHPFYRVEPQAREDGRTFCFETQARWSAIHLPGHSCSTSTSASHSRAVMGSTTTEHAVNVYLMVPSVSCCSDSELRTSKSR